MKYTLSHGVVIRERGRTYFAATFQEYACQICILVISSTTSPKSSNSRKD